MSGKLSERRKELPEHSQMILRGLEAKNLTQLGLSLIMDLSQATVSNIINTNTEISAATALALELVLGINALELLNAQGRWQLANTPPLTPDQKARLADRKRMLEARVAEDRQAELWAITDEIERLEGRRRHLIEIERKG